MPRIARSLFLILVAAAAPLVAQQTAPTANPDEPEYILPSADIQRILHTDKNFATLDYVSPDGDHFLVPKVNELSTLALMSKKTLRLAEMELRPQTNRLWYLDTWGIYDFRFYSLKDGRFVEADLPEGSFASDFTWSPDGARVAFLAHLPDHTEVWTADAATGRTRSVSTAPVMATAATSANGQGHRPSEMLQWTPEGTLLTLLVPPTRGPEPADDRIPEGPLTRHTRPEPVPNPTYRFLMRDDHDEDLFEYYTTSQLAELSPGKKPILLGQPKMYESIALSPDGRDILAVHIERPFSFLTSYRGFPRRTEVLDRKGAVVSTLVYSPLREGRTRGGGANGGSRDFGWRPDGAGLAYLQRAPKASGDAGSEEPEAPRPDRLMLLVAPFDTATGTVVAESEDPIQSVNYSLDGAHAFATVTSEKRSALVHWRLGGGSPARDVVVDFHGTDDLTKLPGDLLTERTGNGLEYALVSSDGSSAYLEGAGYAADFRPQPFVDRVPVTGGTATRLFEGAKDSFDQPLVALDADLTRMVASRESVTDFPDSYVWTRDGGWGANLTNNVDPFPEVTTAKRIDFEFTRRDGLKVQGRVSMPIGWEQGDPPVPAMFWDYPREYEHTEDYVHDAVRARNHNAFTQMSWLRWSDIWLTQGYALVYPDIPIIGENYNDTYVSSLVDAMYGAVRAVDELGLVDINRIGHGGHSYGAFATANILANAPFFKAGIAGDGAYNRSLTPDGFQAERRSIWEAPQTYLEMSPFFKADQIDTPLLMYHGADDNNTGTFPIQSERMISALTILGKTAVLYEYPYESHTPRSMENKLDMWARFIDWFDRYVKNAPASAATQHGGG